MVQQPNGRKEAPTAAPAKTAERRGLTGGLAALSAAAILSVYAAGYLNTSAGPTLADASAVIVDSTAAPALATGTAQPAAPATPARSGDRAEREGREPAAAAPAASPTATTSPAAKSTAYRDGTYTGTGTSRHGSIEATVVIKDGKIASADITSCGTRYSCSLVAPLVSTVVSTQKAPTTRISGATDSSTAYRQAITAALARATA